MGQQSAITMNNKTNHVVPFLLVFSICWLCSCGRKSTADCAYGIQETIRPGLSHEFAEAKLKECGFKTTYDRARNIVYGDKFKEGDPVTERTQVVVSLDPQGKVAEVRVSRGLIGP
jgi:hypothetical protein